MGFLKRLFGYESPPASMSSPKPKVRRPHPDDIGVDKAVQAFFSKLGPDRSNELFTPIYVPWLEHESHISDDVVLPYVYVWRVNATENTFSLSVNGQRIASLLDELALSRKHALFSNTREKIMQQLRDRCIESIQTACTLSGKNIAELVGAVEPDLIVDQENRAEFISVVNSGLPVALTVPFPEKDEVKRLGARWDDKAKTWFAPNDASLHVFSRWLPLEAKFNIRSPYYYIAETLDYCWKCGEITHLFGFILPEGHDVVTPGDDEFPDEWWRYHSPGTTYYVTELLQSVQDRVKALTSNYYIDYSRTTQSHYWMNHCEHCGMKQGDFAIFCEPGGAFYPSNADAAELIVLREINEPFQCEGGLSYGDNLLESMRRTY